MKQSIQFWFGNGIALCTIAMTSPIKAQVVPDATLPSNSSISSENNTSIITGGTRAGSNLFHSFEQFSLPTGSAAYFNNALDIQNIINRVTGSSASNIDGLLQANGTANLFVINPNGIIFGPNATLSIGGSFIASTASSLNFADGTQFSATSPQATPLLTVSVPIGLQFGGNARGIQVQGNGQGIRTTNELIDTTVGLRVQPNQTLALVGGNVALSGGTLKTAGGRIELGSVAGPDVVRLTPIDEGWALGYSGVSTYGDIYLSQQAAVDASGAGGGDIQVRGGRVTLQDGSSIEASTLASEPGGELNVSASESVEVIGTTADGQVPGGLFTLVYPEADGAGGNLTVETQRLIVRDGAQIAAGTFGEGSSGTLAVRASDSVELIGINIAPSGLFTSVEAMGDGGNITIETGRLIVQDGAQLQAATSGEGDGGILTINALDSVELSGAIPTATLLGGSSGVFVSAEPGATGSVGELSITTGQLIVQNGAKISADNFGPGRGGNATLNVRQLIVRNGGLVRAGSLIDPTGSSVTGEGPGGTLIVNASESVEVSGTGTIGTQAVNSILFTGSEGIGDAGNLNITTGRLTVQDSADVAVSSTGTGNAGNLTVQAGSIELNNNAALRATTTSGNGGNITLQLQDLLLLRRNSEISSTAGIAEAGRDGGNITINSPFIVAFPSENSDITANAFEGRGGFIQIAAQGVFGIERGEQLTALSDITAFSQQNPALNGVVQINTQDVELQNFLTQLAANFASPDSVVAGSCLARRNVERGSFIVTGTGGLPSSPYEAISTKYEVGNIQPIGASNNVSSQAGVVETALWKRGEPIREAQGMTVTADGRTIVGTTSQLVTLAKTQNLICPSD